MPINKREVELGVLVGLVDTVIFLHFLPPAADVRQARPFNPDVETAERQALMVTTAFTLLVAGFARSLETFMIAGTVIIGVDFAFKHANAVSPETGKISEAPAMGSLDMSDVSEHPLPDYQETG